MIIDESDYLMKNHLASFFNFLLQGNLICVNEITGADQSQAVFVLKHLGIRSFSYLFTSMMSMIKTSFVDIGLEVESQLF